MGYGPSNLCGFPSTLMAKLVAQAWHDGYQTALANSRQRSTRASMLYDLPTDLTDERETWLMLPDGSGCAPIASVRRSTSWLANSLTR